MARYKNAVSHPHHGIWRQYLTELNAAFDRVRLLDENRVTKQPYTARESLDILQDRMTVANERHRASMGRRRPHSAEGTS